MSDIEHEELRYELKGILLQIQADIEVMNSNIIQSNLRTIEN